VATLILWRTRGSGETEKTRAGAEERRKVGTFLLEEMSCHNLRPIQGSTANERTEPKVSPRESPVGRSILLNCFTWRRVLVYCLDEVVHTAGISLCPTEWSQSEVPTDGCF
jgi:hypothetical protein